MTQKIQLQKAKKTESRKKFKWGSKSIIKSKELLPTNSNSPKNTTKECFENQIIEDNLQSSLNEFQSIEKQLTHNICFFEEWIRDYQKQFVSKFNKCFSILKKLLHSFFKTDIEVRLSDIQSRVCFVWPISSLVRPQYGGKFEVTSVDRC